MKLIRRLQIVVSTLALASMAGCGGGGGGNNPPPPAPPPAPSALSYPAHGAYTVGTAITALTPSVTGTPTAWSMSPAAPAGLTINGTTGVISGTPTAASVATNYTVTASNTTGSTSAVVSFTIDNDVPPTIRYAPANHSWATGTPVSLVPTVTGGAVVTWSVVPALPAGLALNTTTGVIAGTPTAGTPTRRYVITGLNSGGSSEFTIEAAVNSSVLLELGHATGVSQALADGARVLTIDGYRHVVLWNAATGERVASLDTVCEQDCIAIAGGTFAVRSTTAVTVYSATTGTQLGLITVPTNNQARWGLASDGSYVYVHTQSSVSAWSPAGVQLFSRPGNYLVSRISAAPGELRIGGGPAGLQLIETVTVPGNVATNSATFPGTFHSWFTDGTRFLTVTGNVVGIYSPTAVQAGLVSLPSVTDIGGQANWIWSRRSGVNLDIYPVGNSATPAATFTIPSLGGFLPGKGALAAWETGTPQISIIDLAPATPTRTDVVTPYPMFGAFASLTASEWWLGTRGGVVLRKVGATPFQRYNLGIAQDIAANSNTIAIATDAGPIKLYNAATLALVDEIDFRASDVEISADGTVLVARATDADAQYSPDQTLRVYSLPSKAIVGQFPYTFGGTPHLLDFDLSDTGTLLGQGVGNLTLGGMRTRSVSTPAGAPAWSTSDTFTAPSPFDASIRLSPSGLNVALPSGLLSSRTTASSLYANGVLVGAVPGFAVGWIDETRLLLIKYRRSSNGNQDEFDGMSIVNAQGSVVATPALTAIAELQRLTATTIYSPELNQILDLQTGDALWSSAAPYPGWTPGAVAGSNVIFQSRATVRVEPR